MTPVFLGNPQLGNTSVGEKILDIDKIRIPAFGESGPLQPPYDLRSPSRWNFDLSVFKNLGKIVSKHGHRVIGLAARFEF